MRRTNAPAPSDGRSSTAGIAELIGDVMRRFECASVCTSSQQHARELAAEFASDAGDCVDLLPFNLHLMPPLGLARNMRNALA